MALIDNGNGSAYDDETGELVYPDWGMPGQFAPTPSSRVTEDAYYTPWDGQATAPTPGIAPAPPTGPAPSAATGIGPFTGSFTAPAQQGYPDLPGVPNAPAPNLPAWAQAPAFSYDPYQPGPDYTAPDPYTPGTFTSPSVEQMLVDPSYQWRKSQGEDSLQRWAAARGTLNDSGTAKSLLEYGGNAASQEYSNIWNRDYNAFNANEGNRFGAYRENEGNRFKTFMTNETNRAQTYDRNRAGAVDTYNTNYQTQFTDPYKAAYQTAIDTWIPQQETWRAGVDMSKLGYATQTGLVQQDNQTNYGNAWNQFLQGWDQWKDTRDFGLTLATA